MNISEYSFRYAPVQAIFLDQRAIKYMTKWYAILQIWLNDLTSRQMSTTIAIRTKPSMH
jgi:hypothetical protein